MPALLTRARCPRSATRRGLAGLAVAALLLSGCSAAKDAMSEVGVGDGSNDSPGHETTSASFAEPILKTSVKKGATDVPVSSVLSVTAKHATLKKVTVSQPAGALAGTLSADSTHWIADDRLEPGVTYTVKSVGTGEDGDTVRSTSSFTTEALTLDQQTYPSVAPLDGETVGIGMPVVVTFDIPVTDKASFERNMHVTTTPEQPGTWHWVSDTEAHYRPKKLLEGRHRHQRRPRHQRRRRRRRDLRPGGPSARLQHRRRERLQGQRPDPSDEGLLQRLAAPHDPDHDRRAAGVHDPVRREGDHGEVRRPSG